MRLNKVWFSVLFCLAATLAPAGAWAEVFQITSKMICDHRDDGSASVISVKSGTLLLQDPRELLRNFRLKLRNTGSDKERPRSRFRAKIKAVRNCSRGNEVQSQTFSSCTRPVIEGITPTGEPLNFAELTPEANGKYLFTVSGVNFFFPLGEAPGELQSVLAIRKLGRELFRDIRFELQDGEIKFLTAAGSGEYEFIVVNVLNSRLCLSNSVFESYTNEPVAPDPVCGNGTVEEGEQCDDGNTNSNDGCSSSCTIESVPPTATCSSITQYGITWIFDRAVPCGQFANDDWWIAPASGSAVNIISIDPPYSNGRDGWMDLVTTDNLQALDNRALNFSTARLPNLAVPTANNPYSAQPYTSILKAISRRDYENCNQPALRTAAVLTVLPEPITNSRNFFRPPYYGAWPKMMPSIHSLRIDRLPSLPQISSSPNLAETQAKFQRVGLGFQSGGGLLAEQATRPLENQATYGPEVIKELAGGILRSMLNDPINLNDTSVGKTKLLINLVQRGIDDYYVSKNVSGQAIGRAASELFAAAMLDNQEMKDFIANSNVSKFYEKNWVHRSPRTGQSLWGQVAFGWSLDPDGYVQTNSFWEYAMYWQPMVEGGSYTQAMDPYQYIEGGDAPLADGGYMACCYSYYNKHLTVMMSLMPELVTIWNYEPTREFARRYFEYGFLSAPDPCAPPVIGRPDLYMIAYGPNPIRPGECILDPDLTPGSTFYNFSCQPGRECGRFPYADGHNYGGGYGSAFTDELGEIYGY